MIAGWVVILTALIYLCCLFAIAHFGDTHGQRFVAGRGRALIYPLTLAVYCTSWTFFGSVGLASSHGLDFLPIYIGPILMVGLGFPLLIRVIRLAKSQNIASVADFLAARYGKSERVAAVVAVICLVGASPYVALQLKAISASLTTMLEALEPGARFGGHAAPGLVAFGVAIVLAGFAMAFGTRRINATAHNDGLMLAIAAESLVKLIAFLCVGAFVTWGMFDGVGDLVSRALADPQLGAMLSEPPDPVAWLTSVFLSGCAILLLPRQFHVAIVENRNEADVKSAAWIFPLYLVLINLFVVPLAIAGRLVFAGDLIDRDMTVLALPLKAGANLVALVAMIGGLSAATAMVIVACVALSIMVSNDLVMPLLLRGGSTRRAVEASDPATIILAIRRLAIVLLLGLSLLYSIVSNERALASMGLLSFAAIAQLAPAFIGGLTWPRANARGATAGLVCGALVWAYTLLLPTFEMVSTTAATIVAHGPLGFAWLRPTSMFGAEADPLVHGVVLSLAVNIAAFVIFSWTRALTPLERMQSNLFVTRGAATMGKSFRLWRSVVSAAEVEATVARYLGPEATRRAFVNFAASRGEANNATAAADIHLLRFAEHSLASAIGAPSSRLVLSLLLGRRNMPREDALKLVDDASSALVSSRDMLQHALDFARQGIAVYDKDMRLVGWNREFRDLFDLPPEILRLGVGIEELVRYNAERGFYGPGAADEQMDARLELLVNDSEPSRIRSLRAGKVIESRSARMPEGGLVTTYTDISQTVAAEVALAATNETLEQRVRERTDELVGLNEELARAKAVAEQANSSKTRFLAAASHDLLQPLNAARLYASSLVESLEHSQLVDTDRKLVRNIDASLEAVEEILGALLDISRLDAGAMKVELSEFRLGELFTRLRIEFEPLARQRNLELRFVSTASGVRTDRRLMRRVLQNLISNAIKYSPTGKILVGVRRRGANLEIQVHDTGIGIPPEQQTLVFREFERLAEGARAAAGVGLGLSIVKRIARVLGHEIRLRSRAGGGSMFAIVAPRVEAGAIAAAGDGAIGSPSRLSRLRVIAIDNDPAILEGMRALLGGWGCEIIVAADEKQAMARLEALRVQPDVIIADYHLDVGDGLGAIAALRARYGAGTPAVLLSADRTPAVRERAAAANVRPLSKPLKPATLRALLSQWRFVKRAAAE